jgi:hypothetical protein
MANERDANVHRLWRGQPREEQTMSIEVIRTRAEQFDRSNRRTRGWMAAFLSLLLAKGVWEVWAGPDVLERTGDALLIAAMVYAIYHLRHYYAVAPKSSTLGLTASVDFYRTQLARQHELASGPWRYLVVFVPGIALSVFGGALDRPLRDQMTVAALGVAVFVGVAWVNSRTARKLQREIDTLG